MSMLLSRPRARRSTRGPGLACEQKLYLCSMHLRSRLTSEFSRSAAIISVGALHIELFVSGTAAIGCINSCLCRTGAQRARIINKFADLLEANVEELAQLETLVTPLA